MDENTDFKPIETQEEFEKAVEERLQSAQKQFEGYISPDDFASKTAALNEEISALKASNSELSGKIKACEISSAKIRIANESGIPFELAEMLSGESEKEIRAEAEKLSKYIARSAQPLPKFSGEKPIKSTQEAAYLSMLESINNK